MPIPPCRRPCLSAAATPSALARLQADPATHLQAGEECFAAFLVFQYEYLGVPINLDAAAAYT